MFSAPLIIAALRILLVLAFAFSLLMLVMSFPGDFAHDLGREPEAAHILWPMFIVRELGVIAFLLVILCTWKLLTMVKQDRIFSDASMRWVNIIVWTCVIGWLILAALATYLVAVIYFTPELRDPGIPMFLLGVLVITAVMVLVVVLLRELLKRATALQHDLEEVI